MSTAAAKAFLSPLLPSPKEAVEAAKRTRKKIILIDGERLAELMIEHNVGVSTVQTFALKKVDSDYFSEE